MQRFRKFDFIRIEKEKELLTSHFQNGVTLKRKEMLWQHIADSVNTTRGDFVEKSKKTKCSDLENCILLEEIEKGKELLTSHFQSGVTLKRKEMLPYRSTP